MAASSNFFIKCVSCSMQLPEINKKTSRRFDLSAEDFRGVSEYGQGPEGLCFGRKVEPHFYLHADNNPVSHA